jgi:hypothetical protein
VVLISVLVAVAATWHGIFVAFLRGQFPVSFSVGTFAFAAYALVRGGQWAAAGVASFLRRGVP